MKFSKGNGDGDKGKVILEAVKVLSLEHRSFKQLSKLASYHNCKS